MTDLIEWKGRPVPWVTRWTNEVARTRINTREGAPGTVYISYEDGRENREACGILWTREGIGRGGDPEFAQVNAYRQRACMAKRRCQICGDKIPEGVIRWLMSAKQLETTPWDQTVTMSPPTCESCIPISLKLCPHLKANDWVIANVLEYRIWGVSGDVVLFDQETGRARVKRHVLTPYEHLEPLPYPYYSVFARQQVVEFTKFTVEGDATPWTRPSSRVERI